MLQCRGLALLARRAGTAESALGWSRNPFLSTNLSKGAGSLLPDHAAAAAAAVACVKKNDSLRTLSSSSSKQDLLIDTLEVMRGFEQSGLKREEADVLTRHVTKLILQTSNQFSAKFASQVSACGLETLAPAASFAISGISSPTLARCPISSLRTHHHHHRARAFLAHSPLLAGLADLLGQAKWQAWL